MYGKRRLSHRPLWKICYVSNADSDEISACTIDPNTGVLTSVGAAMVAGMVPSPVTTTGKIE